MFPCVDSWGELKLENTMWWIKWVGIVVGIIGLLAALWWNEFRDRVSERLAKIKETATAKDIADATASAKEAKLLIPKTTGMLVPGNQPTPETNAAITRRINEEKGEGFVLFWGSNASWVSELPLYVLTQGGEPMLAMERTGDGISISAKMFNQDGKAAFVIDQNVFSARDPRYRIAPTPRDSATPTKLTVINDNERPVLEVEFLNPKAFRITGDFHLRYGQPVGMLPDGLTLGHRHNSYINSRFPLEVPNHPPLRSSIIGEDKAILLGVPVIDTLVVGQPIRYRFAIINASRGEISLTGTSVATASPDPHAPFGPVVSKFQEGQIAGSGPDGVAPGIAHTIGGSPDEPLTEEQYRGFRPLLLMGAIVYVDTTGETRRAWFTAEYKAHTKSFHLLPTDGNIRPYSGDWEKPRGAKP